MYGLVITAILGYGLNLGNTIASRAMGIGNVGAALTTCTNGINPYFYILLFPFATVSFSMLSNAYWTQLPGMAFCALVGFLISYFAANGLGSNLASSVASFAVGKRHVVGS